MKTYSRLLIMSFLLIVAVAVYAQPQRIAIPKGTPVNLAFDQDLSSKTAKVGQAVALHVIDPVTVNGHTIIPAGTKVSATISKVEKRKRYGINASMRLVFNPIMAYGKAIPIIPRTEGKTLGTEKTGQAAGATVGGAAILGPIGLLGGYFITGKSVEIKAGDPIMSEVATGVYVAVPNAHNKK